MSSVRSVVGGGGGVRGAVSPSGPPAAWPHPRAREGRSSARGAERWGRRTQPALDGWKPKASSAGSERVKDSIFVGGSLPFLPLRHGEGPIRSLTGGWGGHPQCTDRQTVVPPPSPPTQQAPTSQWCGKLLCLVLQPGLEIPKWYYYCIHFPTSFAEPQPPF